MTKFEELELEVPDGGWGWFVVIGVAVTNMFCQALVSVFGFLFGEELEKMGHETTGAALVMNSMSMVTNFSGLMTGPLIKRYSYRKVAIAGGVLTALGMMLTSITNSMTQIIITYSFITGLGLGLLMPSTFVALNTYFKKKRSRAVGFALAGTGLGQIMLPHLTKYLLEEYGFKGTTLIIGALALHSVAGCSLFQPVKWHMKPKTICETDLLLQRPEEVTAVNVKRKSSKKLNANALEKVQFNINTHKEGKFQDLKNVSTQGNQDVANKISANAPKIKLWSKISKSLDLNLLLDPAFVNIIMGISLAYTSNIFFSMIFPYFLQEGIGFTRSQTAMCMSVLAGSDLFARLTVPTIAFHCNISSRQIFLVGAVLSSLIRSVLALQTTYESIIIASLFCGYVRALFVINQNLVLSDYCKQKQDILPSALGLNMVNKGIVVLTLGQILGWLRDQYGSFMLCIHLSSILLCILIITWTCEFIMKKIRLKRSNQITPVLTDVC